MSDFSKSRLIENGMNSNYNDFLGEQTSHCSKLRNKHHTAVNLEINITLQYT